MLRRCVKWGRPLRPGLRGPSILQVKVLTKIPGLRAVFGAVARIFRRAAGSILMNDCVSKAHVVRMRVT